jgi:hypothetical protein
MYKNCKLISVFLQLRLLKIYRLKRKLGMSTGKADKILKLTHYLSVSLYVRQSRQFLTAAVFVKFVTERNVCLLFVGELY